MSLYLTGNKTVTQSGTPMTTVEIYTGEAQTCPFTWTNASGTAINLTGWTFATSIKYYTCNTTYSNLTTVDVEDLVELSPQPNGITDVSVGTLDQATHTGQGWLYIPSDLTGGAGSPATPILTVADSVTYICIITMTVTNTNSISGKTDISRLPIGIIVRYQ